MFQGPPRPSFRLRSSSLAAGSCLGLAALLAIFKINLNDTTVFMFCQCGELSELPSPLFSLSRTDVSLIDTVSMCLKLAFLCVREEQLWSHLQRKKLHLVILLFLLQQPQLNENLLCSLDMIPSSSAHLEGCCQVRKIKGFLIKL